jgi:hypothetical protein
MEHEMNLKAARELIQKRGLTIMAEQELNDGKGTQLRTEEGPILDVYNSGKVVLCGKRRRLLRHFLVGKTERQRDVASPVDSRPGHLEAENVRLKASLADRDFLIESMKEYLAEQRQRRADDGCEARSRRRRWR